MLLELRRRVELSGGLARLGQALWMLIGECLTRADLLFARSLLGEGGDECLWDALTASGTIGPDGRLSGARLGVFLATLASGFDEGNLDARLVWTLPSALHLDNRHESYLLAAQDAINTASVEVVLVSPFMEVHGIGQLMDALVSALQRGVTVNVFTHGADVLSSYASHALEQLRRSSGGLRGRICVFSTDPARDLLVHSKLIIVDARLLVVGSANLTGRGLATNLEAGVVLGGTAACEALAVVQALLASDLVRPAFST